MEEKRTCDGHCERCNINQRTYCAAQISYYNQQSIGEIVQLLKQRDSENVQTEIGLLRTSVGASEENE